jgi:hypothetical protein
MTKQRYVPFAFPSQVLAMPSPISSYGLVFAFAAAMLVVAPTSAAAQQQPPSLRVTRQFALGLDTATLRLAPEVQRDAELRNQTKSARAMLVVGTTMMLSGIAHAAAFGHRNVCYEPDERLRMPPVFGGLVAAVGATLVFRGGFKLANVPDAYRLRHPPSVGKRVGMAFGVFGLLVLSQATMFAANVGPWVECISS